jgi:fructokinase
VILVAGEALVDLVPDAHGALRPHPGGGPFNTARTIGRLGQPAAFLGRLSTDRFGRRLERMLLDDGVDLGTAIRTDDPTTLALAELDEDGAAQYRFYERGTSAPGLQPAEALSAIPDGVAVLHVGTLGIHLEPIADAVEALVDRLAGTALVVVDPNVRPGVLRDPAVFRARLGRLLERADLVKLSADDLAWLAPGLPPDEAVRSLLGSARAGVLTLGGDGALVVTGAGVRAVAAPRVEVVDTIGAGDAFGGGLVAWWRMQGLGREELGDLDAVLEATRFACRVAALTCSRAGASPPTLPELRSSAAAGRGAGTR